MTEEVVKQEPMAQEVPPAETTSTPTPTPENVTPVETVQAPLEVKTEEPQSLLSVKPDTEKTETKAPEVTPEITPEQPEQKEQQVSQSDEPAPQPTYEEFKAPEDFTLDAERIGDFTKELAEFEIKTHADHAEMQSFGQRLIERHVAEVKKTVETFQQQLLDNWEQTKTSWREAFENDPELGGNRRDTVLNAAREFIEVHGGTEEQKAEIRNLMHTTGVGNHPAMIRLLAQAAKSREYTEGQPLPATIPSPTIKSKIEKRYGVL